MKEMAKQWLCSKYSNNQKKERENGPDQETGEDGQDQGQGRDVEGQDQEIVEGQIVTEDQVEVVVKRADEGNLQCTGMCPLQDLSISRQCSIRYAT